MTRRTRSCFTTRLSMLAFMNQVEIWRSHLVRKLLKRGHFVSLNDLRDQILAFIASYHQTMAKPIKWTYTGISSSWRYVSLRVLTTSETSWGHSSSAYKTAAQQVNLHDCLYVPGKYFLAPY